MKTTSLIFLTYIFLSSCGNAINNPTSESSVPATDTNPPLYPLPQPDSYTYVPAINNYQYANTAGGYFMVSKVYIYKQDYSLFRGISSDGTYIYILNDNSKAFAGSYLINRFKLDGTDSSTCTWYGDGYNYSGIGVENNIVYLKRYDSGIKIAKYDFSNCSFISSITINPGGADADGYSYVMWNRRIFVHNGNFYFNFIKNAQSRIKYYSPTNLMFQSHAESQNIGSEILGWDSDFFISGANNWTVRDCSAKSYTMCLWRQNTLNKTLAYAYLPKEYYPEMDNGNFPKTALLPGRSGNELLYSVFTNGEVHFYVLDVSAF